MKTSCVVSSVASIFSLSVFSFFIPLFSPHFCEAQTGLSYRVVPLGTNFSSGGNSYSYRMSDSGIFTTGITRPDSNNVYRPFTFSRSTGFVELPSPFGFGYSWGQSINDSGKTLIAGGSRSYVYDRDTDTYQELPNIFGGTSVGAQDINNNLIVGAARAGSGELRAFLWNNGVFTDLTALYGITDALKINDAGDIMCVRNYEPCLISNGILHIISSSGNYGGDPNGMNNSGTVVGMSVDTTGLARGFKYNGVSQVLPIVNGFNPAHPKDISDCDQIVGTGFTMPPNAVFTRAFLMWNGQVTDLNSLIPANSGWVLEDAVDISRTSGRIIVNGKRNGEPRSAMLVPNAAGVCP